MSEMQDRVTAAILPAFDHINDKDYRRTIAGCWARAAIEAMREPTESMIMASNREWDGRMSHRSSGAWRAMIDAALTHT